MDATTLFEKREEGGGQGELISLELRRSSTTSTSTATSASKSNSRDVEQSEPLIYRGPGAGGETGLDNGTEAGHGGDADLDLEALKEAVGRRRESEDQGQPTKVSPWIMSECHSLCLHVVVVRDTKTYLYRYPSSSSIMGKSLNDISTDHSANLLPRRYITR
jgi:hypothetical protein